MLLNDNQYLSVIETVKAEISKAQYKATLQVNREMILLYHGIGKVINEHKTWGSKFIDNLAKDIKIAFPASTGYSVRNLKYMAKFAAAYPETEFVQQVVAQILREKERKGASAFALAPLFCQLLSVLKNHNYNRKSTRFMNFHRL